MTEIVANEHRQELYARLAHGMAQLAGELSAIQDDVSPDQSMLPFDGPQHTLELLVVPQVNTGDWEPNFEDISQLYHDYVCYIRDDDYQEGDELRLFEELVPLLVDNFALDYPRDLTVDELKLLVDRFIAFMNDPMQENFREQVVKEIKESE
jgi:hypothetical protein